jgi:hypothetical protein
MASLADQFLADAGGQGASAPSLADQFLADAGAKPSAPAPAAQAAQSQSFLDQLGHQLGLTARAGVTGVTALPAMVGDALNAGINKVFGTNLAPVSASTQDLMNRAGVAQPQNATERVVQDAASAMAGTAPSIGLGKMIPALTNSLATNAAARTTSAAASPVAQAVGRSLQVAPGMQMLGSAGAGAASSGAHEAGLNPAWQVAAGLLGGAAGVGAGSLATAGVRAIAPRFSSPASVTPRAAATLADSGVDQAINELGPQARQSFAADQPLAGPVDPNNPAGLLSPLKQQVAQGIQQNPGVSPAAVMRAQDFRDLGIQPTLGQITRDPTQFSQELNMRGLPRVGDALSNRFNQQNTQLQQALYGLAGNGQDAFQAGSFLKGTLGDIDASLASDVRNAYAAAKASSGKNIDVPLTGLAQDYAQVLNDFGDKVPSGVRNNFNQLGLMGGTQQKTFSIESAENLLKVINANQSSDPATNAALAQLRGSVKNAILSADDQGGVYAPARQLAAARFALHDQIPALEAAASNSINPDDFVRRFVVGGKTDQVVALANLLKSNAPDAFNEARNQLGAQLAVKGFGQNVAGDAPFKPASFAQAMQNIGQTKLGAFYSPDELAQLNAIGRVGSYMNAFPSSHTVNTSGTGAALAQMLDAGVKKIPVVGGLLENAQNRMFVNKALAGLLSDAAAAPVQTQPSGLLGPLPLMPSTNRSR